MTKVKACGFLLETDAQTIPDEVNEITMFAFVVVYRQMDDGYIPIYNPYLFNYVLNKTERFGCGEIEIASLGWNVSTGNKMGVIIPQLGCFQFFTGSSVVTTTCPAHMNMVDPIENCSQTHYFQSTAWVVDKLHIEDSSTENVFINLNVTVGEVLKLLVFTEYLFCECSYVSMIDEQAQYALGYNIIM